VSTGFIDAKLRAKALQSPSEERELGLAVVRTCCGWGWTSFIPADSVAQYMHTSPTALSFCYQARVPALERQCMALRSHYAGVNGVSPGDVDMEDVWRHFKSHEPLVEICREFLCKGYDAVVERAVHFLGPSSVCSEMESIISDDDLHTSNSEVQVLQTVIQWSMMKKEQENGYRAGDEVRVKPDFESEEWREVDCVIQERSDCQSLLQVKRLVDGKSDIPDDVLEIAREQLYSAAETGMMRLLRHVRWDFIPIEQLKTELDDEEIFFASKMGCYREIIRQVIEVRVDQQSPAKSASQKRTPPSWKTTEMSKPRQGYRTGI